MILRRFCRTMAAVGFAGSALLGGSVLTAGPAAAATQWYDVVETAAGTNSCEYWMLTGSLGNAGSAKNLDIQTHGVTYSCFVQVVDTAGRVRSYTDYPGNGWSNYVFAAAVSRVRACQNGNPGRCSGWKP
jgi:hypothetical protein